MGEDSVTLRRAGPDDVEAAATIMVDARHASIPAIPPPVNRDDEIREWFRSTVMVDSEVWVAVAGTEVAGVMALSPGWLEHLYLAPHRTGAGIGSLLVRRAQELAPASLDLWTFVSNTGARRFYERHGFVIVGGTDGDNEEGQPDLLYRWTPARAPAPTSTPA